MSLSLKWNWQIADWPKFAWDPARLEKAEQVFLMETGVFTGTVKHIGDTHRSQIVIEALSTEAATTSEIEGEVLDRASVQSSVRRELGFAPDKRRSGPKEQGIAEMMVDLHRTFAEPLSEEMLCRWHGKVMKGRPELAEAGRYRTDERPMEIVSGGSHAPKVHFEAPPSSRVKKEMARFVKWHNRTAPGGRDPLPGLTRAGMAHLYFESIHPFEDGNGRIGRAISEKALAQALGRPTLTALAATILVRRKAYYAALERASRSLEITAWLAWFAGIAIEAQRRTTARIEFLIDKSRLLDRLRGELNERQEKALLRMLREGPDGFQGGMSAGNYATITGASPATTTRDLADMVAKGALRRTGERRHARYFAEVPVRVVGPVTIDGRGEVR
jgi:Fic family protein